ncbi:hypothetical protein EUX98_g5579 [Antrodiella citrinella]|uniref:Phosphatidylethanolamine-binding protein n=1 Tax=Antrodiella citrinella TaxID=2447956 RepID=A0A4S4MYW5_9APHY|nr:hypothetical protein EUX98_g5579 [Antrodiella citrinella]
MAHTNLAEVKDALKKANIIPDVVPNSFSPTQLFTATYSKAGLVKIGQEVDVDDAQQEPELTLVGEITKSGGTYTVAFVDPDARPLEGKTGKLFRHWLITGLDSEHADPKHGLSLVKSKKSTTAYKAPAPRPGTGIHRYVFLLFQEPSAGIDIPKDAPENGEETDQRRSFDVLGFAERYGLNLVGASFFLARNSEDK